MYIFLYVFKRCTGFDTSTHNHSNAHINQAKVWCTVGYMLHVHCTCVVGAD
jgi:hypothetical protein